MYVYIYTNIYFIHIYYNIIYTILYISISMINSIYLQDIGIWMHLAQWNHAILGSWLHRRTPQQLLRSRQHRHCWQWLWAVATHRRPRPQQAPPLPRNPPWRSTAVVETLVVEVMLSNFGKWRIHGESMRLYSSQLLTYKLNNRKSIYMDDMFCAGCSGASLHTPISPSFWWEFECGHCFCSSRPMLSSQSIW